MELALRKLRFSGPEIAAMSTAEAEAYLEAYAEMVDPSKSGPKYVVKRQPQKGRSR